MLALWQGGIILIKPIWLMLDLVVNPVIDFKLRGREK